MSTGKKKALQQHWETRGHGLVNYENFLPQIQTNSAAAVSAPAAGGTLSRGAGLLPATSPFHTTSRPPHRLVLRTLEIIDGPSQDAGVHAGAALQRRVLLQIWIQVQKGHKRIWHNLPWEPSRSMCRKGDRCDAFADGIHPEAAQRGNGRRNQQSQRQLYSMPPQLREDIAAAASNL